MSFTRGDCISLSKTFIGSHGTPDRAGGITDTDYDRLLDDALAVYSSFRPDIGFVEKVGDNTTYEWKVPDDWEEGFSSISRLEYPTGRRVPALIDPIELIIYEKIDGLYFRLLNTTPASGYSVRFEYTKRRTISEDGAATSVSDQDKEAVAHLVASYACARLAAEMAKVVRSALGDDPLALSANVNSYQEMARSQYSVFERLMGISDLTSTPPAIAIAHLRQWMSWGRPPLTHEAGTYRFFYPSG